MLNRNIKSIIVIIVITMSCNKSIYTSNNILRTDTTIRHYFNGKLFIDTQIVVNTLTTSATDPDTIFFRPGKYKINSKGGKEISDTSKIYSDSTEAVGLSELLYHENESRLPSAKAQTFYRFVWIKRGESAIIKLYKSGHKFKIETKWLLSHKIISKKLSANKVAEFKALLNKFSFWSMKPAEAYMLTTDGSCWLIEGQEGNKYHFVYRRNPSISPYEGIFPIGQWLIQNSGVASEHIY
jgi:hypothetical protein